MTTIRSTLQDGINPRRAADMNSLGLALTGLLHSTDDNSGRPRLAPIPLPFAVLLGGQDERAVAVGPGQRYDVKDGELFCISTIGATSTANSVVVTLADDSTITIAENTITPIDCWLILGPGDAVHTTGTAFLSGTVCRQPGDITVQSMILSDTARYRVPDDAAFLLTAAVSEGVATLRIDGRAGIRAPSVSARASTHINQTTNYFERNVVAPVVCAPGQILDGVDATAILVTGLLLPALGTAPSATALTTNYSDGAVRPAEALNRPARLLRGAGITDDNGGNPILGPGVFPVPVRIAPGAVQAVAIMAPGSFTVPIGKLLLLNNFYALGASGLTGEISITPSGGSPTVIMEGEANTPAIGATATTLLVLGAGDVVSVTVNCICAGTLIDLPAMVAGRILQVVDSGASYTVAANERAVITAAILSGGAATAAVALEIGGTAAMYPSSLGTWQTDVGANSVRSLRRVRLRPFVLDTGQVVDGSAVDDIWISGVRYSVA